MPEERELEEKDDQGSEVTHEDSSSEKRESKEKKKSSNKKKASSEVQENSEETETLSEVEELQATVEELTGEIASLKADVEEKKADYLRKHADFENFRKRMQREKADFLKYASQDILIGLLEVSDNFQRAIASADETSDFESFKKGIELIANQLNSVLVEKGEIDPIPGVGAEYDPNLHEALMQEESEGVETATILEEFQKGYKLYDRVIRTTKVKVGIPVAKSEAKSEEENEEESEGGE